MIELEGSLATFRDTEIERLVDAYGHTSAYLDCGAPLGAADRRLLAKSTIMAGVARRRLGKRLDSVVDAYSLSADVLDFFLRLKRT